ncbi:hypothetical protein GE21DRAFT_1363904 [Neurospora crassa]|nr:hypothetical protein GE21DRAFT_1363904 [Neurospora crassa]
MDPISHHLNHWVRFISRLATLSISMHQGYHSARTTLASFLSLFGTIFRALANLSHSNLGLGASLSLGLGSSSSGSSGSRLQAQDLLLLLWALLRLLRHHLLRRLLRRLVSYLLVGYLPADVVGFFGRVRPALELPGWLRQLASAPPPLLPSAAGHPFALPPPPMSAALPFGPSSSVLPSAPSFGLPGLPTSTPWHLANYRQGVPLPPPPYMQGQVYGQPTGYYPPPPPPPPAAAVPPAPSLPPSAPPSGQLYGQLPGTLAPRAPFAPMSVPPTAPTSGPPAVPAQTPGLHHLRQLRQQRQLQQSQSGSESGGGEGGGGTPR